MAMTTTGAWAQCAVLPSYTDLKNALVKAVTDESSGLNLNMWGTIVARDGTVCAVAFSGNTVGAQWLGSRVISAQKANTANLFSLDSSSFSGTTNSGAANGLALSTANLYSAVQPGGSLFGLQESPVDTGAAYGGDSGNYGTATDPMNGTKIGGINVFGGGLALYGVGKQLVGGVGVSGDTSCADHMIAGAAQPRTRSPLRCRRRQRRSSSPGQHHFYDIAENKFGIGGTGVSAGGFGHPTCINTTNPPNNLPAVQ